MNQNFTQFKIPIKTPVGIFNAWAATYGNPSDPRILIVQGGPGTTHDYLISTGEDLSKRGFSVSFFGPIGTDYSEKAPSYEFCSMDWFVDELDQIVNYIKAETGELFLLGHSWGGYLCIEYLLRHQSKIKSVVASNAVSSIIEYNQYCKDFIVPSYPEDKWAQFDKLDKDGDFSNPLYTQLLWDIHFPKHVYRHPVSEWPDDVMRTFTTPNIEIYGPACGPSPISIRGWLSNWNASSKLSDLYIPSLFISSSYDTNSPMHIEWMSNQVANGSYLNCPNSGHFCHLDDKHLWNDAVSAFFK